MSHNGPKLIQLTHESGLPTYLDRRQVESVVPTAGGSHVYMLGGNLLKVNETTEQVAEAVGVMPALAVSPNTLKIVPTLPVRVRGAVAAIYASRNGDQTGYGKLCNFGEILEIGRSNLSDMKNIGEMSLIKIDKIMDNAGLAEAWKNS